MEKVMVQMEVPKESKEVVDFLAAVVDHFKKGKPLAELAAIIPAAITAADGWDKIKDELSKDAASRDELGAYLSWKVLGALGV